MSSERPLGPPDGTGRPAAPGRRAFLASMLGGAGLLASRGPPGFAATPVPRRGTPQAAMPTRPVPVTGEAIPIVGLGSSKAVLEIPAEGAEPVAAVLRRLVSHGGRLVDTSPRREEIDAEFGRVLQAPDLRDRLFVTAKINTDEPEEGVAQFEQTRRVFGRSTLDLLQVESLRGLDHHWPRLLDWKEAGAVRYVGVTVSNEAAHARLEAFMRAEQPDFVHVNYSVMEPAAEQRILPLAADRGMAVLINRPFMNGAYFRRVQGRPLPDWAAEFDCSAWSQFSLKYILANPAVTCVLTETTNPAHMDENVGAAFGRLPDEEARSRMKALAGTL